MTKTVRNVKDVFMSCKGESSETICVLMRLASNYPLLFLDWFAYDPNADYEQPSIMGNTLILPERQYKNA